MPLMDVSLPYYEVSAAVRVDFLHEGNVTLNLKSQGYCRPSLRVCKNSLKENYTAEKEGADKFITFKFFEFSMKDNMSILDQVHEFLILVSKFQNLNIEIHEKLLVGAIITKLPSSWHNYRKKLMHTSEDFTLDQIQKHIRIEEETRIREKNLNGASSSKYSEKWHIKRYCKNLKKKNHNSNKKDESANAVEQVDTIEITAIVFEMNIGMIQELHMAKTKDGHEVIMSDNHTSKVIGSGNVEIQFTSGKKLILMNVLHVPNIRKNIMKDMNEVDTISGIKLKRHSGGYALNQCYYIDKIIDKFQHLNIEEANTPYESSCKLVENDGRVVAQIEYASAIGCLIQDHWKAIGRVFGYLERTRQIALYYDLFPAVLEGYSDASWITSSSDSKSITGWVFTLDGKEAEWLRNMLLDIELWPQPILAIFLHCDSQSTLSRAYNKGCTYVDIRSGVAPTKFNTKNHGSNAIKPPLILLGYLKDIHYVKVYITCFSRVLSCSVVRSMWLFKHKFHADGSLSRYKACLVANGRSQIEGIDCDETFSPVVKPATIHTVLSLALSRDWPIYQLDVKNVFLHGSLSETVYMRQPPGFTDSAHPDYRSLYGLKQAPRAWFQRFTSYATRVGFYHSKSNSSLFIFHQGSETAYLLIYVDDIILTASSSALLQRVIYSLHSEFDMTGLGSPNYFLGISATRSSSSMFLTQSKYAGYRMLHCNPCRTLVDTDLKLGPDGDPVSDPTLYSSLAGALQYLTFTHPDITYAVQHVCLFMHDPREPHFAALKRILRYVRGTLDSDADWESCPTTRRSTSAYCVFLGDNLLSWSSKRQHTISRSSDEAEYRGVANVVTETAWLRNLLHELHTPLQSATLIYCDNVSAVYMSSNPVQHQRTKHIEIDIHFVRDKVATGHVRVLHVPSRYQYADIFTKGLPSSLFTEFQTSLSVHHLPLKL
ncbi:ribonuclease H-like domain-containing protein [Tanacetum coccineum]